MKAVSEEYLRFQQIKGARIPVAGDHYLYDLFSAQIKTKPKKGYGIKKIKGFNRVVNIGWSYIIKKL